MSGRTFALVGVLLIACGGKSHEEESRRGHSGGASLGGAGMGGAGAGGSGLGGTAGSIATAGNGGRPVPERLCDAFFMPSCVDGDTCTCRDDPRPECQSTMTCDGGWKLALGTCSEPVEEVSCPETPEAARDMPCRPQGKVCDYPGELSCACLYPYDVEGWVCDARDGPNGPTPLLWYCGGDQSGCPVGIPAIGSPCAVESLRCGDPCANNYARACNGGVWEVWVPTRECV